jgi:glutamate racemase
LSPKPNDYRPIGVFDSGVGGLSVLRTLRKHLPDESFIYVADSGFAPYGDRSSAFIEDRVSAITEFLVGKNVKSVVIACNTATVTAVKTVRAKYQVPIIGLEPAIKPAVKLTRSGVVGILATERTINSDAVANLCHALGETARFILQPCPGLVEHIENGDVSSASLRSLLTTYLEPLITNDADTIVIGCTHYVFLTPLIREIIGSNVAIVESSDAVARQVERRLSETEPPRASPSTAKTSFYTTGSRKSANKVFSVLLDETISVESIQ